MIQDTDITNTLAYEEHLINVLQTKTKQETPEVFNTSTKVHIITRIKQRSRKE